MGNQYKKLTIEDHQAHLLKWKENEYSENKTAEAYNISRATMQGRLRHAKNWLKTKQGAAWGKVNGIGAASKPEIQVKHLTELLNDAKRKIADIERDNLRSEQVREYIFGLSKVQPSIPDWVNDRAAFPYRHGFPSLFLSDIHYGEVVDPKQVFGVNKFNASIAVQRVMHTIDTTLHLTFGILKDPKFPGIALILGGDNINGVLRDESLAGNDRQIMTQAIEVADLLHSTILKLIKHYGKVFVVGVPGNHGRDTKKPWADFYAETNFDWLVYQMLERFLQRQVQSGEVAFTTPPARDVTFRMAGRGFRLTHGDQFRGGDSIIGPLGPITRGDNKKRAMAMSLPTDAEDYDTLLVAHFHRLYMSPSLIINGAIKGYDAYALSNNFSYEPPQQALFFTHEKYGINHYLPVLADEPGRVVGKTPWVEFKPNPAAEVAGHHVKWSGK
jgi:hypothetical protein